MSYARGFIPYAQSTTGGLRWRYVPSGHTSILSLYFWELEGTMSDSPLPNAKLTVVPQSPEDQVRKAAVHDRYALDAASAKLLKENGRRAVLKMFEMLNDEEKWNGMGPRNQMALIDMAITRAYGRVETVTAEAKLADATSEVAGALPHHLRLLAGTLNLPELQGAKSAKKD